MSKEALVVIDIETVSAFPDFDAMDGEWQQLWYEKIKRQLTEGVDASEYYRQRAAVMAEFGKVVCIGVGWFSEVKEEEMSICLFYGEDEKTILLDFISKIEEFNKRKIIWAGHNIREFDLPFLCRRMLINSVKIPDCLNLQHTKPWDNNIIDTFQYWRFGDYKNYTSLKLLAQVFGMPSSKKDMDGSMVGILYWERDPIQQKRNMIAIAEYCKGDVATTGKLVSKMLQLD